jgi:hypothetical protein
MLRSACASAVVLAAVVGAHPARAGGCDGPCYREVHLPPVYGTVIEKRVVRAPRTYALVTPPEYVTVTERVLVQPARRVWATTRDSHGRLVGCWVERPAKFAQLTRRVQVGGGEVVPYAQSAAIGYRAYPKLVAPPSRGWEPLPGRLFDE